MKKQGRRGFVREVAGTAALLSFGCHDRTGERPRMSEQRSERMPVVFVGRRHGASKLTARVVKESLIVPWRVLMRFRGRTPR